MQNGKGKVAVTALMRQQCDTNVHGKYADTYSGLRFMYPTLCSAQASDSQHNVLKQQSKHASQLNHNTDKGQKDCVEVTFNVVH